MKIIKFIVIILLILIIIHNYIYIKYFLFFYYYYFFIKNIGLNDISILQNYKYIQQLELSGNEISGNIYIYMKYIIKLIN